MSRGSYDFECWEWVNPRYCGLMWGPPRARVYDEVLDEHCERPREVAKEILIKMLCNPDVTEWWAHNGGKYDTLFILEAIEALGLKARGFLAAGRLIVLEITDGKRRIKLYDSQAVIPGALKQIADDFELPSRKKLTADDYAIPVQRWSVERLREGCRADCEVVLDALDCVETLIQHEGGRLCPTFSSSALSIVKAQIDVPKTNKENRWKDANKVARKAYCGGRVEIFRHFPQTNLAEWDINSSYPWAMSQMLPWQLRGYEAAREARRSFDNRDVSGVFEATVSVPLKEHLPYLPFVSRPNDGMFFPVGTWRAWFTKDELEYAMKQPGFGMRIHGAYTYDRAKPFSQFITAFYALKSHSTGAKRNFAKLILNGCYGKFGQSPEKETLLIFPDEETGMQYLYDSKPGTCAPYTSKTNRYIVANTSYWSAHTHYALAATITALGRIRLHQFLRKSSGPAYCDTDSVHANMESPIESSKLLGDMKIEIAKMRATFFAPKLYELHPEGGESVYASKGFKVDAETFRIVTNGGEAETERMQLVKQQIRGGGTSGRRIDVKRWSGLSGKRKLCYDVEGTTQPWNVREVKDQSSREANTFFPFGREKPNES